MQASVYYTAKTTFQSFFRKTKLILTLATRRSSVAIAPEQKKLNFHSVEDTFMQPV